MGKQDPDDEPICVLSMTVDLGKRYGEPTGYILNFSGKILSGDDANQPVGVASFYLVDLLRAYEEGEAPWEVLDCYDSSLAHFCTLVSAKTNLYKPSIQEIVGEHLGRLLVIGSVEIDQEYRGKGLGRAAVEIVCERFSNYCSLAVLKAFPIQWEGRVAEGPSQFRKDRAKLIAYYRGMGFTSILSDGLMAKSLLTF